uniref:Protein YIF1 n=1 Tax=Timema tahoe TaxID=61484 RepID=A0A7R9ITR6_9NEOP|nr:unnamed protein product [Timema tahoe]
MKLSSSTGTIPEGENIVIAVMKLSNSTGTIPEGENIVIAVMKLSSSAGTIPEGENIVIAVMKLSSSAGTIREGENIVIAVMKLSSSTGTIPEGENIVIAVMKLSSSAGTIPEGENIVIVVMKLHGKIIFAVLLSLVFQRTGYFVGLIYSSVSLAFFLLRTLKVQVLLDTTSSPHDPYRADSSSAMVGNKRRLYILLLIAGIQPVLMWWLSYHLTTAAVVT